MIATLICLAATQKFTAADFFPSTPGLVRTYERKGQGTTLVQKIGDPLDMGGVPVIPILEQSGSAKPTYYRIDPDQVSIVAYDLKHPLPQPMPVLKIGKGEVSWSYTGATATGVSGERMLASAKARPSGTRTVLGKKVDVVTVDMLATVGIGESGYTLEQTTVYAKGIGMVELTTKAHLGHSKRTAKESYYLIGIEPPK